jgi:hypothetical protein
MMAVLAPVSDYLESSNDFSNREEAQHLGSDHSNASQSSAVEVPEL